MNRFVTCSLRWFPVGSILFVRLNVYVGIQDQMCMCVPPPYRWQMKILQVRVELNVNKRLGCGCDVINVWLKEAWNTWAPGVQSER